MINLIYHIPNVARWEDFLQSHEELGKEVFVLHDDYSVGPLHDFFSGMESRRAFWDTMIAACTEDEDKTHQVHPTRIDQEVIATVKKRLAEDPSKTICIWMAENAIDLSLHMALLSIFEVEADRIFHIYIDNLPFFSEEGRIFFPKQLGEIPMGEIHKCQHLRRKISLAEIEMDKDIWYRLSKENGDMRILKGYKQLQSTTYAEGIDKHITQFLLLQKREIKIARIIHHIQSHVGYFVPLFIWWRITELIRSGDLIQKEYARKQTVMYDIEVRSAHAVIEEKHNDQQATHDHGQ